MYTWEVGLKLEIRLWVQWTVHVYHFCIRNSPSPQTSDVKWLNLSLSMNLMWSSCLLLWLNVVVGSSTLLQQIWLFSLSFVPQNHWFFFHCLYFCNVKQSCLQCKIYITHKKKNAWLLDYAVGANVFMQEFCNNLAGQLIIHFYLFRPKVE